MLNFSELISSLYPNLIPKLKKTILISEKEYTGNRSNSKVSFLWEHTVQVASIAFKLSMAERIDPVIPVITALFHDSGKFFQGKYHLDEVPEEKIAGKLARKILKEEGMEKEKIQMVITSLTALYNESQGGNVITNVVHDSDFLAKFGFMGVANFFLKSALRGRNLQAAILTSLSKELTYASSLPLNMRTESGRKLAEKKKRDSLNFFYGLLDDLCQSQTVCFKVEKVKLKYDRIANGKIEIFIVIPSACLECGGKLHKSFTRESGIKCKKLITRISCLNCSFKYDFSFCLPEINGCGQ